MTKDGIAFCLGSADLAGDTTAKTTFSSKSSTSPEIQPNAGIFCFDLTWSEIQTLKRKAFFTASPAYICIMFLALPLI